ncbi:hypothetical protein AX16_001229 [Volvariella volvacea WC 439]|nr:hypothetical protein AX16_001229 [Volvariella volvacea WC 439]
MNSLPTPPEECIEFINKQEKRRRVGQASTTRFIWQGPYDGSILNLAILEPPSLLEVSLEDTRAVFNAREVIPFFRSHNLALTGCLGHSPVARFEESHTSRTMYMKLVSARESDIHAFLRDKHPHEHNVVSPIEIFGGLPIPKRLILTPDYGCICVAYTPPSNPSPVLPQLRQLCKAIAFLHRHSIAHLDIKPANVCISENPCEPYVEEGRLTVIDLGTANFYERGQKIRRICGTPDYTAPEVPLDEEQLEYMPAFDPFKADVWSTGRIIRAMFWRSKFNETAEFLNDLRQEMQNKDPEKRPDMEEVVRRLEGYEEREGTINLTLLRHCTASRMQS